MTDFLRRMGRAVFGICVVFAVPAYASDDVAADWRRLLAEGDLDAIFKTYTLIDAVRDESGAIDAARCRDNAEAIDRALVTNPVGLGVWYMAQECARAGGDEALAQRRMARFEALLRHTFAPYRVGASEPMRVLAERDVDAIVAASGQELLYALYQPYDGGRHFVYTVGLWDEKTQRENLLEFDYLDTVIALNRADPATEFPGYRRSLVRSLAAEAAKNAPDLPLARIHGLEVSRGAKFIDDLRARAPQGDLMAAMLLGMICTEGKALNCRDEAIDALLPFAEKRYSMALVTLAFVYARRSDGAADLAAARALLEQADARLGGAQGSVMFQMIASVAKDAKLEKLVEKNIAAAARRGDLVAGLAYARLRTRRGEEAPGGAELKYIEAGAAGGIAQARQWLAEVRIAQKRPDLAAPLMRSAAEAGNAPAQYWLGLSHLNGENGLARDEAAAFEWLAKAGRGGIGAASAMVGAHYLDGPGSKENLERAREWLLSATQQNSVPGARELAKLYARDIEGIGSAKDAVRLYEAIIERHDDAESRRELATLLEAGRGAEKDEARAESLLRADAQKGDAGSQAALGVMLVPQTETEARRAEGRDWLRKSAEAGNPMGRVHYASALWYGRGGAPDHANGRKVWESVIRDDDFPWARNDYAWALCTPRDAALLDAKAGLAAIEQLAMQDPAPIPLVDTYAACQAATGDYEAAVKSQQRVIALVEALKTPEPETLKRMRDRLAQYQRGERPMEDQ